MQQHKCRKLKIETRHNSIEESNKQEGCSDMVPFHDPPDWQASLQLDSLVPTPFSKNLPLYLAEELG